MLRKFEDNCEIIRTVNFLDKRIIKNSVIGVTEKKHYFDLAQSCRSK